MVQELKARGLSERLACSLVQLARSSFRYRPQPPAPDEEELRAEVLRLARGHRRYGYRRITALLRRQELRVNAKRIYRIWKSAGFFKQAPAPTAEGSGGGAAPAGPQTQPCLDL